MIDKSEKARTEAFTPKLVCVFSLDSSDIFFIRQRMETFAPGRKEEGNLT